LNCIVVDGIGVLESVSSLVLLPLLIGLGVGKAMPSLVKRLESIFPLVGVLATLILVAGGASNSVATSSINATLASYLLPLLGGAVALLASHIEIGGTESMDDASRRTLVVETLSKSPTLAYVLAKKHFGQYAAAIPASGMVSLAVVGAAVASTWSMLDPIENTK
jgi:BASS family bile acid:Na+ symporter